jgi:hypothetical protein
MPKLTNPGCSITYAGLRAWIDTLTPEQLACNVSVYSGDVDEAFPVFGTTVNTDEEMGEELDTLDSNHPLILI